MFVEGRCIRTGSDGRRADQQTIAIDLSISWNTSSVPFVASNKTSDIPLARSPELWYDSAANMVYMVGGGFYAFAGAPYYPNAAPGLWGFKPQSDGKVFWQLQPSNVTRNIAYGLSTTTNTSHISLGGHSFISDSTTLAADELRTYNFGRASTVIDRTLSGTYFDDGVAHYIPNYGTEGVIVFLGGNKATPPNFSDSALAPLSRS